VLAVMLLYAAAVWVPVAPGVESLRATEDGVDAELVRFDLARFRPRVVVLGAERPRTAAALREETRAAAAVNGGFFDEGWRSLGLRIADGKVVIGLRPRVDWGVLVLAGERARIVHSREFRAEPGIDQAIQVGPRILVDGQPVHLKPQSARRTAVALDREGRTFTLVVTHAAAEAQRLAELLAHLGFHSALMFDGGPSSQLSAAAGALRLDLPGAYPVPDALVVHPRR
jgi:exopolysaccharide biosynthesis protein